MKMWELVKDGEVLNVVEALNVLEAIEWFFSCDHIIISVSAAEGATVICDNQKFIVRQRH